MRASDDVLRRAVSMAPPGDEPIQEPIFREA